MKSYVWVCLTSIICVYPNYAVKSATPEGYKIAIGDTIEVSVVGIHDLDTKSIVSQDGYVLSPMGGQFRVVDMTIKEARDKAREEITTKLYRQRTQDGKEAIIQISPDEVQLSIFLYRPIYVSGDVSKPGEQSYRPGMTVRQAISMAGGYEGASRSDFIAKKTDAESEFDLAFAQKMYLIATSMRLESELQGFVWPSQASFTKLLETNPRIGKFIEGEKQQFLARQADFAKEKETLSQSLIQANKRLSVLSEQQKVENESSKADLEDFNRLKDNAERGVATNLRVTDARRASLLSASRALQTTAQVAQLEKEREEVYGKLSRLDGERRVLILKDMQENRLSVSILDTKLDGLRRKMRTLGIGAVVGKNTNVLVHRKIGSNIQDILSSMDSEVLPGDVIELVNENNNSRELELKND